MDDESFRALCDLRKKMGRAAIKPPKIPYHETHEKIVNGSIRWKPIDKTAAIVTARALPIHLPPDHPRALSGSSSTTSGSTNLQVGLRSEPTDSKGKNLDNSLCQGSQDKARPCGVDFKKAGAPSKSKRNKKERKTDMSDSMGVFNQPGKEIYKDPGTGEELLDINKIALGVVAEIEKKHGKLTPLALAAVDARRAIDESMNQLGQMFDNFDTLAKQLLGSIRQNRFAIVSELHQIMTPMKDLRSFFSGPEYDSEIRRLQEFVDLCERLEGLQQRGTLDAVSDTLIKLTVAK